MSQWTELFQHVDIMYLVLSCFVVGGIIFLWLVNRDKEVPYCITDLIVSNGKLSERKITRLGAWIVSTWGFVYLIYSDNLSEWYFVGYMGAWVANALISKAITHKDKNPDD